MLAFRLVWTLPLAATILLAQSQPKLSRADIDRWMTDLSNWGRWGKEDQMGTINLITPAKRRQGAALVREGVTVSLARDAETQQAADNQSPFSHEMTNTYKNAIAGQYCLDRYSKWESGCICVGIGFHYYGNSYSPTSRTDSIISRTSGLSESI